MVVERLSDLGYGGSVGLLLVGDGRLGLGLGDGELHGVGGERAAPFGVARAEWRG